MYFKQNFFEFQRPNGINIMVQKNTKIIVKQYEYA